MKTLKAILCVICLAIAIVVADEVGGNHETETPRPYALDCVLVEYDEGDAIFEDNEGNLWAIPEEECGIAVGSDCVLVMDDAGTPTIYDDIILEVIEKNI